MSIKKILGYVAVALGAAYLARTKGGSAFLDKLPGFKKQVVTIG